MSFYLNNKIKEIYPEESIYKVAGGHPYFSGLNIPSFIKDWIVKRYTGNDGVVSNDSIQRFLEDHLPGKDSNIKGRLLRGEELTILARALVEIDISNGLFKFGLPDLGIKTNEGIIANYVIDAHHNALHEGETWGILKLSYRDIENSELGKGYIEMVGFQPFKPYSPHLSLFKETRKMFNTEEWIDLLISCMEYNPQADNFDSLETKMLFISRLLVFVEPNLNMIELAPKGTGKSYIFNNLSKYGWQISGGKVTRAKLFYNMNTQSPGLFSTYDFISMDEIKTITFQEPSELQGALKNYLESGNFTVGKAKQSSSCGLILLGNISLNKQLKPISYRYFDELPDVFHDTALLDRFHGFIEGWILPRLTIDSFFEGYSLNVEYFSEILSSLRTAPEFEPIVNDFLEIPNNSDARDVRAVKRLATGYLKLLFPNVKSKADISAEEFSTYCFFPAYKKRSIIRQQIAYMDPEFRPTMPDIKVRGIYGE